MSVTCRIRLQLLSLYVRLNIMYSKFLAKNKLYKFAFGSTLHSNTFPIQIQLDEQNSPPGPDGILWLSNELPKMWWECLVRDVSFLDESKGLEHKHLLEERCRDMAEAMTMQVAILRVLCTEPPISKNEFERLIEVLIPLVDVVTSRREITRFRRVILEHLYEATVTCVPADISAIKELLSKFPFEVFY